MLRCAIDSLDLLRVRANGCQEDSKDKSPLRGRA